MDYDEEGVYFLTAKGKAEAVKTGYYVDKSALIFRTNRL